jgi:hypothetical protein
VLRQRPDEARERGRAVAGSVDYGAAEPVELGAGYAGE